MSAVIEDVQSSKDTRQIPINKVGIKDIRHPVRVRDRSMGEQHTIACFNMYVNLPHNFKGTHMSRFVEILNQHEREISVESFKDMLREMAERLEASFAELASERDALRRFIADASHELRTPITALKSFNDLLQGPAADDPAARAEFLLSRIPEGIAAEDSEDLGGWVKKQIQSNLSSRRKSA